MMQPVEKGGPGLLARVKINGRDGGWLVVDTGATKTMLDAAAAERLGLAKTETKRIGTFGGSVDVGVCKVRSLSLGPVELGAHEILSVDLGFLGKVTDGRAVGMLGGSLLAVLPFTLDYRAKTLTLHHPAHFKPPAGADPNRKAKDGKTALPIAQQLGHKNVVKLFQAAAAGGKK